MKEFLILGGILAGWIALNAWILPWFGIKTCMSGGCRPDSCSSCGPGPWSSPADSTETKDSK